MFGSLHYEHFSDAYCIPSNLYTIFGKIHNCALTWCVQVLRSPKEEFAAAMQSWRERCEKCVRLQGDYLEK